MRFDTIGVWLAPGYTLATAVPPQSQLEDTTPSAKRAWPQDLRYRLMAVSRLMRKLLQQGYVEMIQPWNDQPPWFRVTARGLRLLGLAWQKIPFPETNQDFEARLRHDRYFTSHNHLINEVRLLLARGGTGALSQGIRSFGMRQARYRDQAKVHLQHTLMAVALNLTRRDAWLIGQSRAKTRQAAFVRLAKQRA